MTTSSTRDDKGLGQRNDTDLSFRPIANGVDFLDSALSLLDKAEDSRNLKYAVLHLQAAIEVLIKVRLQREGFEHVFENPYSATAEKLRLGKFRSVTLDAALERLGKVSDVVISTADSKAFKALSDERNKLQHFGSTSGHQAVAARAFAALEALAQFILLHLIPGALDDEVELLSETETLIRQALSTMAAVAAARLSRITPELDAWPSLVIQCPACLQFAWTFAPEEEASKCLFCGQPWWQHEGEEVAGEYVGSIFLESRYQAAKGRSGWSISDCPECRAEACVPVAERGEPDSYLTQACFCCGFIATGDLGSCGRCGRTTADPDDVICSDCLHDLASKD